MKHIHIVYLHYKDGRQTHGRTRYTQAEYESFCDENGSAVRNMEAALKEEKQTKVLIINIFVEPNGETG